ncbi:MFS transporter [Rhodococcus sp. W8901]|uniref:MFS transporter n=1 Tax=Rhodococcus sp. W8901 TaxID=2742603 RepID=UPI001582DA1E|nr:MFS transporter [Rhodococcus sp. W8901]QKT12315.1 MFS transporter [Rhodococcus sp. W8901]
MSRGVVAPIGATAQPRAALATVCAVLFLTFLDTTIVSVTLGSVQSDLHAGVVSLQWVVNAYTLVFASLMLTAGSLGDRWGRKRVMVAGIVIFCVGSAVSAVASTVAVLIVGRAVMGVGAAASEPGTLSVIRHVFPDRSDRAKALGAWAGVSGLALALGPVVGGLLVGTYDWRAVFWFNLVLGAVLFVAAVRFVPESSDPQPGRLDLAGFVLGSTFLGCVIFAGISGENVGYDAPSVITLFVVGGISLVAFVIVELRVRNPMLDFRYLHPPMVRSALIVAFAVYFGVFSIFFFTALYLEEVYAYSGLHAAAMFTPMAVAIVVGSALCGFWVARSSAAVPMIVGCILAAVGILLTRAALSGDPSFVPLAGALTVAGLGFGIAVVPLTSAVLSGVPAAHSGMAAAATNTMRQIGAVVGVAALGALVNSHLTEDLTGRLNDLDIPANFQSIVIDAIKTGAVPAGGSEEASSAYGPIVDQVIDATYAAFHAGLDTALLVSASMIFVAAAITVVAAVRVRGRTCGGYDGVAEVEAR